MQTLLLDPDDVAANARIGEVIDAVEGAFSAHARGDSRMPAKSYIDLPEYNGDFRSMPAYLDTGDWDAAGIKWVNVHPDNPTDHELPTVLGTVVYSDPETAFPLALLDGTTLTRLRTGAAAAVATDYLAQADATSLGLVGAGVQARTQLAAIAAVRDIDRVVVADASEAAVTAFIDAHDEHNVVGGSVTEAAACDVVSTTTPVTEPIVDRVGDRTHVNAIGADAGPKQELATDVVREATIVIDDHEQCVHSGEISVPYETGAITDADIHAQLGEIVAGQRPGRTAADGVTLFDSTGLAIQDIAAARVVYERASEQEAGTGVSLVGTSTTQ